MQDILVALRLLIELATVIGVILAAWQSRKAVTMAHLLKDEVKATPDKVIEQFRNGGASIFPCYKPPSDRPSS